MVRPNGARYRREMATLLLALALAGCRSAAAPDLEGAEEGCLLSGCHARIEQIHYGGRPLRCVDCHLGDPLATTKEAAHVTVGVSFNASSPGGGYLDRPSLNQLDDLPYYVIRFLNPSDYRVAAVTCGGGTLGGASCHTGIVDSSLVLNRATLAGQLAGGGFVAGTQDKQARYGVVDAASLSQLPIATPAGIDSAVGRAFFPVYDQLCLDCHLYQEGTKIPGKYYASGCSGCHLVTDDDARARTADATQDADELGHPAQHRFTNLVPDSQCAHCHVSHLGRALLARGVRERSEPDGDASYGGTNRGAADPPHARPWAEENYVPFNGQSWLYGKPFPFYLDDEDDQNDVDETPPDVHITAGLGCIDCHNVREAHGGGTMATRMDAELDVRCTSCHGRPGQLAALQSEAGLDFERAETTVDGLGANTPVFEESSDGAIFQRGRFDGKLHPVTQIDRRTDPASPSFNPRTQLGCALHAGDSATRRAVKLAVNAAVAADPSGALSRFPGLAPGFTFDVSGDEPEGRVECFTCHNTWTENCYGCHMIRDDRETYTSHITGEETRGKVHTLGMTVVADSLALGFNRAGRVSPMVGTSIFFTQIGEDGATVIDAAPLTDGDGNSGEGNVQNAVHHHTVQRVPRDCDGCHPTADGGNDDALRTAVGLGSGRYTFVDGEGVTHRLDRLVAADFDGDGAADDPLDVAVTTRLRAAWPIVSTTHVAQGGEPGPLDVDTINRVLQSPVVPQRPGAAP